VTTDRNGNYVLSEVAPGAHTVVARGDHLRPIEIEHVPVAANQVTELDPLKLQPLEEATRLQPFIVEGSATRTRSLDHSDARFAGHVAGGNLDLTRTESDVLPFMIFNRTQISRSGVVNLNEFLRRELIDSSASTLPPEKDPSAAVYSTGSTNLSLRGYNPDETVILVNGRRLPEVMTSMGAPAVPPDVNFIPLSLVQQVEVLPVSASSLYSGNAVGGVINIVLRPDVDTNVTELSATYTNALSGFDAPESAISLLHSQTLLDGRLRIRLNANYSKIVPPTEAELGFRQHRARKSYAPEEPVFGATPNVRSLTDEEPHTTATAGDPLFGPGSPTVTSVAPGSGGANDLGAFRGREGIVNRQFFDPPGKFSTATDSLDFPYGRDQHTTAYYGSAVWDTTPWLQLATDLTYSEAVVHRGYETMQADLRLPATSALNPFHQTVYVSLNEIAPALGEKYRESRLDYRSIVLSGLLKLPANWRVAADAQYSHNVVRFRGLFGANMNRWQQLVDQGVYNPLRDTQVYGPPPEFYSQVLEYVGGKNQMVTLGDYDAIDGALRVTNERLQLPTGVSTVNVGADYRRNQLGAYNELHVYADGSLADDPRRWSSRTIARYSFFGELQTPMLPKKWLPKWVTQADADLALRYVASSNGKESNLAPTYGFKLGFPAGLALRGSITTSSRFPTPTMSRLLPNAVGGGDVASPNVGTVTDFLRNGEKYTAIVTEAINPNLRPEDALTETAGIVFERGRVHRFRAAIDFVETHKVNEEIFLDQDKITANEALFPDRVVRAAPVRGEPYGRIVAVYTGRTNLSARKSQNWTGSFDYRWTECFGGTFESYARVLFFQRYRARILPYTPIVDELNEPDGFVPLLRYRANFGASWSNPQWNFGADGHYFHSRLLPQQEWATQGSSTIHPYWQGDVYAGAELTRWLPWKSRRFGLRGQIRVNNVLNTPFPKWVNDPFGTGVEPYGDWRGRVYSVSLTATF
jgi:outer membrane receptor protein involved in Fe transport